MTERSGEPAGFDPRFDPAFQPGYRSDAPSVPAGDVRAAGGNGLGGHSLEAAAGSRTPGGVDDAAGTVVVEDTVDVTDESTDESPRRNPFVGALWALSVLITLGGIGMVRWSFTLAEQLQSSNAASQVDYQLSYMMQQSAPLFIALGLGVAAMAVFLHAQAWNGRRG
jgi:hypothetical protein